MILDGLGWHGFFQEQVDALGVDDVIIGRISRAESASHFWILTEGDEISVRLPGKLKDQIKAGTAVRPGIGDWVLVKQLELDNVIFKVLDRKNHISRKVAGKEFKEQTVGANIDIIFIVMGLDQDYNVRRLERYLFMVTASRALPVVILNKTDLSEETLEEKVRAVKDTAPSVPIHPISALERNGLDLIRQYLKKGVTISLVGSSGVGKSTIINALLGEEKQDTGEVREKDSRGRHVTASRRLFMIPGGGMLIDNPGIREIQLWGDAGSLDEVFADVAELALRCKFKDCSHISEPGCEVKQAVENGELLTEERYNNYLKMRKELVYLEQKTKMSSEAVEKSKWKGLLKDAKRYRKQKRGD